MLEGFMSTAVFAEDIRFERGDQVSIIGIFPDEIQISGKKSPPPELEGKVAVQTIPKLSVYARTHLPASSYKGGSLEFWVEAPSGKKVFSSESDEDFLRAEFEKSRAKGDEEITLISHLIFSPFPVREFGRFKAFVSCMGESIEAGHLSIIFTEQTS
ncbi:MAG: hypothetical protein VYD90_10935 [Pseudomonadota bacterium]|nr:hypothetical protein [Pseudomonadota bacterium]